MSSEAITRNDLTAILNEVLPPTPSEYRKLLWTNPSPTASFATQTVSLDLSDYDEVEIFFVGGANNSNYSGAEQKFPINSGQLLSMFAPQAQGTPRPQRGLTITSTGIVFTAGGYTVGTTYTSNDSYCVPRKIYGIKYDRVLPPAMDALEWKLKGTATGTSTVAMPTDYNEIMLVVTGYSTYYFTMIVAKNEVSSSSIYPRFANYYNTTNNAGGYCEVNNSTARLSSYVENNGTNVTSQATFKLYYR